MLSFIFLMVMIVLGAGLVGYFARKHNIPFVDLAFIYAGFTILTSVVKIVVSEMALQL
jgi:hypothetical protein